MKKVFLAALFVLLFSLTAHADGGSTSTVTFNEIVLPANYVYPQGFIVTQNQCLDVMAGVDALTFYSTITVTLPTSEADSGAFGWTPVDWSIENFPADLTLFLDQWNNLSGVVITDASVTESTTPPSVPEPGLLGMLILGVGLVGLVRLR
jgi:hypothetical protein